MTLFLLTAILVGSYAVLGVAGAFMRPGQLDPERRGQISLGVLFLFTGLGHFVQTDQMAQMLPAGIPARNLLIYASGVFEWVLAAGLMMPRYSRLAGVAAILFLVLVFPGNIYAALNRVDLGGHAAGPGYLLVRGPFQLFLIGWAYWFAVRGEADEWATLKGAHLAKGAQGLHLPDAR